jgi:hypothetical protein
MIASRRQHTLRVFSMYREERMSSFEESVN